MAVNKERFATANSMAPNSHVEVVTENGFGIVRVCELGLSGSDSVSACHFIVGMASGGVRSIKVEFAQAAVALVQDQRQTDLLSRTSCFWLHCAERHLAAYVWENDGCPPDGRLIVDSLSVEDLLMAAKWEQS
ncbi:MAG TPA: hypothetical protein DHU55_00610 [Blastocatellia bacterium]|nr:hypothetical protein [Blastocatellia bacterium]